MSDLITNTNELQRVLSELGSRVVDPSQLETENKTIIGAINELKSGKVSSIDYSTQPDTKMHEIFGYIREKGLIGRWVVLNLLGYETGVYGLGLNWYGGDAYGLYGINLQNGAIASNTNSWTDVPISDFKNSFIHPITSGSLPSELMYTQVEYLNTDAKTIVGAINSLYDIFNEGGADGVGISDITKTGTSGKVDTYTITLTDGNTKTFTVTNGSDGQKGDNGTSVTITNVSQNNSAGGTSTVTFSDGKKLEIKNGTNGTNGTSVTVSNISESTADGGSNVVTFSDGKKLTVKNGNKGTDGDIGYYIKATVDRSFDEATWTAYGTIGRKENWSNTSNAGFRDGDLFLIAGTASDSGKGHLVIYSFFKDSSTRTTLYGTCIGHHIISAKGADGKTPVKGTDYFTSTEIDSIATQAAGKVTVVDEKVKTTARANTDTYYLTGAFGETTGVLKYDSSVCFGTENGELCMKSCNLNTSANPAKLVYDDTKKAIKFIFN